MRNLNNGISPFTKEKVTEEEENKDFNGVEGIPSFEELEEQNEANIVSLACPHKSSYY